MNQHPFLPLLQNCSLFVTRERKEERKREKMIDLVYSPALVDAQIEIVHT